MALSKDTAYLSTKQDLVFRLFSTLVNKQEIGTVKAAEVEQIMAIAEQAAARILAVK